LVISLIRFSDINNRVCVGETDAVVIADSLFFLLSFFFFLFHFDFPAEICASFSFL